MSVHKFQGISIGQGEKFKKAVIHMPEGRMRNLPGLVLTAFTRLKRAADLAIGTDPADISKEEILKIGSTKAYKERNEFRDKMRRISGPSMRRTLQRIMQLDDVQKTEDKKFDVGCKFLLNWYLETYPVGRL